MAEKKYFDTSVAGVVLTYGGYIVSVSSIPQGTTDGQRIGDRLIMNSIEMNYEVSAQINSGISYYRIIVFIWKDDTAPGLTDILSVDTQANNHMVQLNRDKKIKRILLYDKCGNINQPTWTPPAAVRRNLFIDLRKKKQNDRTIFFQSGSTTGVNKIYFCLLSSNDGSGTTGLNYTSLQRINFIDF